MRCGSPLTLNVIYVSCFTFVLAFEFFFVVYETPQFCKFILLCFQFFMLYFVLNILFPVFSVESQSPHLRPLQFYANTNKRAFNICNAF